MLRLLCVVRAVQQGDQDQIVHHIDRSLQLLGHPGLAAEDLPPPEVLAGLQALIDAQRAEDALPLVFLDALEAQAGEAIHVG